MAMVYEHMLIECVDLVYHKCLIDNEEEIRKILMVTGEPAFTTSKEHLNPSASPMITETPSTLHILGFVSAVGFVITLSLILICLYRKYCRQKPKVAGKFVVVVIL